MKFSNIILGVMILFLFVACGGGSSTSKSKVEQMKEKNGIIVFHSYPENICSSQDFKDLMKKSTKGKDIIIQVETNDVTCSTYGRVNNMIACGFNDDVHIGSTSCIVGFDVDMKTRYYNFFDGEEVVDSAINLL